MKLLRHFCAGNLKPFHIFPSLQTREDKNYFLVLKTRRFNTIFVYLHNKQYFLQSETHNPFDTQPSLKNGFFNGLSTTTTTTGDSSTTTTPNTRLELADLKRQILFLQGQLEDRERTVQMLQEQMVKYVSTNDSAHSAPASTVCETATCNAATQTERVRFLLKKKITADLQIFCLMYRFGLFLLDHRSFKVLLKMKVWAL